MLRNFSRIQYIYNNTDLKAIDTFKILLIILR